jgi:Zn-dependent M28 family amino/carboxypeptidase
VDLLHEWRFRVHDSVILQHTVNLANAALRIQNVLQDSLANDGVERAILKWQIMGVSDDTYSATEIYISVDESKSRVPQEFSQSFAALAGTHHEDDRIRCLVDQQLPKPLVVALGHQVYPDARDQG